MSTGARLRRARLDRGLTLDQVSDSTKIQLWILNAIERDDLSHVPGGVFIRGYLAAFARAVGVDTDEILTEHFGPPAPPAVTQAPDIRRPVYTGTPPWQAAALTVLVIATAVVWSHNWRAGATVAARANGLSRTGKAGAASKPSEATSRVAVAPPVEPTPGTVPAASAQPSVPPVVTATARVPPEPIVGTAGTALIEPPEPTTEPTAPSEPDKLVVALHATGDVWVEATADGDRKVYRLFKPGEDLEVDAQKEVHLVIGDASAATYTVNGVPSGPLGGIGVVREITITP
jgi:cytoskeletal protein RodZ